jgi:hypothetical protein
MLSSIAARAAGRSVRIRVDAEPVARRVEQVAVAAPESRRPAVRDEAMASHPLVREVSALFDATIVRVEAAGSLSGGNPQPAADADSGDDSASDQHPTGDHDV